MHKFDGVFLVEWILVSVLKFTKSSPLG